MGLIEDIPDKRKTIQFECTGCGECCRNFRKDWTVQLYYEDLMAAAKALKLEPEAFVVEYCQAVKENYLWTDSVHITHRIELKKVGNACILLKGDDCRIYGSHPFGCKQGPFLYGLLGSESNWRTFEKLCEGVGRGKHYSKKEIGGFLELEEKKENEFEADFSKYSIFKKFFERESPIPLISRKIKYPFSYQEFIEGREKPEPEIVEENFR